MRDTRERPVCHRAEDLVSYLYGEAGANEALDFNNHLQQCDACRGEFAVFNQVHDSIQLWRNEALGASFDPVAIAEPAIDTDAFVRHERKLSALAALREFFTVAPLWLRGATAFAGLLLCVLAAMLWARVSQKPVEVPGTAEVKIYSQRELQDQIKKAVDQTRAELTAEQSQSSPVAINQEPRHKATKQTQVAANQPKPRGLNREERAQLAADLRLTLPADDDELLIAMPQQDIPNR
jgi:anti-sigma factor RsiW